MKVLISYHHNDNEQAERLERDLNNQHIGIWIDKQSIKPGGQWLKDIDNGLSKEVDYILGIVTKTYIDSFGGVEAYAAMSNSLSTGDRSFIPLFFEDPKIIDSLITKSISGFIFTDYEKGLLDLIKFLKSTVKEDPSELLSHIEGEHSKNPFRRTRAEYFENEEKLALAFTAPEEERYELIRGRTPLFVFGGRGSGKTMALKSLTAEVMLSKYKVKTFAELKSKGIDYFGIYLRLVRGSFSLADHNTIITLGFLNTGVPKDYKLFLELSSKLKENPDADDPIISSGINAARIMFLHELNYKVLRLLIMKVHSFQEGRILEMPSPIEQIIVSEILKLLGTESSIKSFEGLRGYIDNEINKIKDYLQKITLPGADISVPDWVKTSHEFLDGVCTIFSTYISDLNGTKIYLLLDEYENLYPFQQMIVNEWIKTASSFTVKIGSKFEGMHTNMTLQGQPLQFKIGECDEITLDYDLFNESDISKFKALLKKICSNILALEGYVEHDIEKILEEPSGPELPREIIDEFIRRMVGKDISAEDMKDYRNKFEVAAVFRALRERGKVEGRTSKKKIYAGFDTYTYLSSGIIRVFLNLVGMAFYRAEGLGVKVKKKEKISVEAQSWAAQIVSKGYLEKIHKNIEAFGGINGEMMYQFVTDLGDIFRERLLYHSSEPEILNISLSDPQQLSSKKTLNNFFKHAVKESVLYKKEETSSYRPKKSTSIRPKEFVLNRVYTPALEISHRARWGRCHFSTKEVCDLLSPDNREDTKKRLQLRQRKEDHPSLFEDSEYE